MLVSATRWGVVATRWGVVATLVAVLSGGRATAAGRQVVVAADGTGQFRTIATALESVRDASQDNPVDILIKPGTYAETITTRDWINLVGENRETCVITYAGGPEDTVHKHTIWATSNTAIRNLTLVGLEVKYVIHSDGGAAYLLTIENCTLRREYPTPHAREYAAGFGIGLRGNQHIVMRNCLIEADLPIYWHNWDAQKTACSMTLEQCVLKGKKNAIGIYNLGSGQKDCFVLHDCVLESEGPAVDYANLREIKGTTWNGHSETVLLGSGNTMGAVSGSTLQDDAGHRLSGSN
jgi:hypothetical protein